MESYEIKELPWEDDWSYCASCVKTSLGDYVIKDTREGSYTASYCFTEHYDEGIFTESFNTLDEAKAFCKEDWFKRVIGLLTPIENVTRPHRTDKEILYQTEVLARELGSIEGWFVKSPIEFYKFQTSDNPRCQKFWRMACAAQELLTDTDPNNCEEEE